MQPRHWYHCSEIDHGPAFDVARRAPEHRSVNEPETPRLCVCRTVAACFAARLFDPIPVHVYRTETPRRGIKPRDVWDQVVTGEHWLIPPTRMVRERVIAAEQVRQAFAYIRTYHRATRKNSDLWMRIAQYAIALDVVGGSDQERRKIERISEFAGIGANPEAWVVKRTAECLQQSRTGV